MEGTVGRWIGRAIPQRPGVPVAVAVAVAVVVGVGAVGVKEVRAGAL